MNIPDSEIVKRSAIAHLRELMMYDEADLLSRCKIEIDNNLQSYIGSTKIGLYITLRCNASYLEKFFRGDSCMNISNKVYKSIKSAIEAVLPAQLTVHDLAPRSFFVKRNDLELLIEEQMNIMVDVATGGSRIEERNEEYKYNRKAIKERLNDLGKNDPNSFKDLWDWFGRWRSGDLPSYQSRREYIRNLYDSLIEDLSGSSQRNPAEPNRESTGWEKVDRNVDMIISSLSVAECEEKFQAVGLLCRECLISLSQSVYKPEIHKIQDGVIPSKTDASRMLEAYFAEKFSGSENEALRRHAKAALVLANDLQHKRTATYRGAALCSEATRTVVNIVRIASEKT